MIDYDVMPDGDRFLVIESFPTEIHVVLRFESF